jgi:uncharacterized RmlC-like cupin family protein
MSLKPVTDWRDHGVQVIPASQLDLHTPQTPNMTRAAAITAARTGASQWWAGTFTVEPHAKTGPHHHGQLETVISVVRGRARMRWGEHLECTAEAGHGAFIYVPPFVPHQEINASGDERLSCVVARSGQEPIVVHVAMASVEPPEAVSWVDPSHPHP